MVEHRTETPVSRIRSWATVPGDREGEGRDAGFSVRREKEPSAGAIAGSNPRRDSNALDFRAAVQMRLPHPLASRQRGSP